MAIELISSYDELQEGGEVTFEIVGLEPHAEGGTYIARWIIDPPGSLRPTGEAIVMDGADIYSIFSAAEPVEPARVTFEVRAAESPVTVAVDVRYRRDEVPLGKAHEMHVGRAATSQARLHASERPLTAPGRPRARSADADVNDKNETGSDRQSVSDQGAGIAGGGQGPGTPQLG